ncbi:hypothetical protein ACVGVM_10815 [Pseudonocardia bannensis]|uniref:DUF2867 domain-containing protein n=1 Tax=Pseudonocardia bannensis TaxID=630973 RepID=A0A848DSR8_9PSEU|nr:hypothetical protein [Pseudonocardia bannensis]NMH95411.1 hypothetical protein [Pseudonocardia bannensis]
MNGRARRAAGIAGACALTVGGYATARWARYGHIRPQRHPADPLLDRFLPDPDVDEYHRVRVRAPAAVTYTAAREMDLTASPLIELIFRLRALPLALHRPHERHVRSHLVAGSAAQQEPGGGGTGAGRYRGLVDEALALGWGVLTEAPGREIVVGCYTQPWHRQVRFHALAPEDFATFSEPGYVKIAWTVGAEPIGPGESMFVTRTRVAATDPVARRRFRRYWVPMSAGIVLIRYLSLPLVKREAERRAAREVMAR